MLTRNDTSEWYYVDGGEQNRHIKQMMDDYYSQSITINQSFWSEADTDTRFKVGDQSIYNDYYGNLPAFRRRQFYFNRIRRICNLITGYQRRNRKSIVSAPVENNDNEASDQISQLLLFTANKCGESEMISEAFESGAVTTGMSLLHYFIDHTHDPESGDICCSHVPYNSFLIDPYFKKKDLKDCNFIWRRQWISKNIANKILPGREDDIARINPRGNRDGKFQFMAEAYNYGMQNLLALDEFYYLDMRTATFLIDPATGLSREWNGKKENLKEFLRLYPQIVEKQTLMPTVKLAMVLEGHTMYDGPQQTGSDIPFDRYPFVPFIGYYEPNLPYFPWRVQGVVRNLRDSQFLYNRRKVIELDILESQVNSGIKYKPGSLVNPQDVFLEGQGRGIAIKDDKEMTDVEKIQPAQVPPSMLQLSEILGKEVMEISGVNEELLGSADDDKAGILAQLRQGAGLTTLQVLFDQLDFSMKLCGEIRLELIQKNYSVGKIRRILNEEPIDDFKNRVFMNYDIVIEEGINTTYQRQMQFMQLLHLREVGVNIPSKTILEAATLQNKNDLIRDIEAEEQQAAQQQQQQAQLEMAKIQMEAKLLESQAMANQGLGMERIARINENAELAVERRAKAIEDLSDARLNKAKTLTELQNLDVARLQQLLAIADLLEQKEKEGKEAELAVSNTSISPTGQRDRFNLNNLLQQSQSSNASGIRGA